MRSVTIEVDDQEYELEVTHFSPCRQTSPGAPPETGEITLDDVVLYTTEQGNRCGMPLEEFHVLWESKGGSIYELERFCFDEMMEQLEDSYE